LREIERRPDQQAEDEERQEQVDGEADVADLRPVDQARGDHPPADRALQPAEHEQAGEPPAIAARDRPLPGEPEQRKGEGEADEAAEQPVDIFPEDRCP
jgi:rhodanese-related sulfurtransferase